MFLMGVSNQSSLIMCNILCRMPGDIDIKRPSVSMSSIIYTYLSLIVTNRGEACFTV